jgi:hypothetical protein
MVLAIPLGNAMYGEADQGATAAAAALPWRELCPAPSPLPPSSAAPAWPAALPAYVAALEAKREALGPTAPEWKHQQLDMLFGCRRASCVSEARLDDFEAAHGVALPPVLRQLWCQQGGFSLLAADCWNSIELFALDGGRGGQADGWPSLYQALGELGVQAEFDRFLPPAELAILAAHYWVFGVVRLDDSDLDLLVFDRDGRIGRVGYRHDWAHFNGEAWHAEFALLLRGELRCIDLDDELLGRIAICRGVLDSWVAS